jgi:alkanesulfonate monooxygenase SsuD/methylene tetrahydromethanopterin reductase-like flavin-dependent oxidoreductase (luciferase family)
VLAAASAVPPVLMARLAAATSSIRIGSGGVMLPNHSPVVVAAEFGTLGAFDPGRIDLGIGRGPGTINAAYTEALRGSAAPVSGEGYTDRVRTLLGYLTPDGARAVRVALAEEELTRHVREGRIVGSPHTVSQRVTELADQLHPDELMIVAPIHDVDERVRSLELIAEHVVTPRPCGGIAAQGLDHPGGEVVRREAGGCSAAG